MLLLSAMFIGLFILQSGMERWKQTVWMQRLYVSALNGFYFDMTAQRLSERVWTNGLSKNIQPHGVSHGSASQ
jgi:hypothetical protein